MKRILLTLFVLLASFPIAAQEVKREGLPSDDEVRKILADRIDAQKQGVNMVVGLVDASGRRIIGHGTFGSDKRPADGDTLFEIGSATKVFTALVLADAVARGEVSLEDPVAKFLPAAVKVPERGGKTIALVDLATHTSGLPRLPSNLMPKDEANPYVDYTAKQLYDFLSVYELQRDIGSSFEYSNLGAGLLGHALALREGTDYETLVRKRITGPLSMTSTAITLTPSLAARLAPGHSAQRDRVSNWDFAALAGAGALRSTANDLLTFLSANLGLTKSSLSGAMSSMLETRRPSGAAGAEAALGWQIFTKGDRRIVWHNGGTGGYRSFVGFVPERRMGVVVLSNTSTEQGVDDIGRHLLDPSSPLTAAPRVRNEIAVDPKVLEMYVGRYELAPGFILAVTREEEHLYLQATGQPKNQMFAESPHEFFLKVVDAQVTFKTGESGRATDLVLHQHGRDMPAKRLEGEVPAPKERKAITLAPAVLDRYVGRYQLTPNFVIAITRDGDRVFLQATGQPMAEMFAEAEKEFFLKVADAQVSFVSEGDGRATKMILHQNGMDVPGQRIE
jgi:CubicO group peptidase (beta-lactamase class C family)